MSSTQQYSLFINGDWVQSKGGERLTIRSPATGETVATVADATDADVDRAVDAAQAAFPAWSRRTALERADGLLRLNVLLQRERERLARLLTLEVGKPIREARGEIDFAIELVRFAAENARRIEGDIVPGSRPGEKILIEKQPHGVIGGITAWNFPAALLARKVAPAIAAGNTIVLKPHELTPVTSLEIGKLIAEAGIPAGVVNIVTGGIRTGERLVTNPTVKLITMTGSTRAGKQIMAAAAPTLKEVRLELGGKAPFIVLEDADLELAASAAVDARFLNAGQVCTSNERTYVHEAVYDRFLELVTQKIKAMKVGDPLDEHTDMGPKVSKVEVDKVDAMVAQAVQQGAKVQLGGGRLTGGLYDLGHFYQPTLLTGITHQMDIVRAEVFGPVVSVLKIRNFDEALKFANDSNYGLSAYLFTKDLGVLMRTSAELNFGEIYVNRTLGEAPQGFHHGYGDSGLGGEDGKYGLEAYVRTKTIYLNA
ncbi:aldehyde dehydrogenase [Paraburkholderia solisilvae]|uniref:3,6-anhydro-alpha-L-galactose dehydrogenase n=1 Tax=Paraburkholderia solisilvae TaxID=624376 RepID=A0A6J5E533_9BURK|nr:aldehyde dehydrogenase [Paraburkholderia solisilvae]CAB3761619.1 3,6-anhydro-alpha-L-galactose dehydrogenase [Paraburkholderia solisilvae]